MPPEPKHFCAAVSVGKNENTIILDVGLTVEEEGPWLAQFSLPPADNEDYEAQDDFNRLNRLL